MRGLLQYKKASEKLIKKLAKRRSTSPGGRTPGVKQRQMPKGHAMPEKCRQDARRVGRSAAAIAGGSEKFAAYEKAYAARMDYHYDVRLNQIEKSVIP